jgi:hypothetical protein
MKRESKNLQAVIDASSEFCLPAEKVVEFVAKISVSWAWGPSPDEVSVAPERSQARLAVAGQTKLLAERMTRGLELDERSIQNLLRIYREFMN